MFVKKLLLIISLCFSIQVYSQVDTAKLNRAYDRLMKDTASHAFQMEFFMAFPVTFMQYYQTYMSPGPNYNVAEKHVSAFRKLTAVPKASYCDRLIRLSIAGKWDADAVNDLKRLIHEYTVKNPETVLDCLSKYSRGYQLRFWQFYWTSLNATHEYLDEYNKLRTIIFPVSPEQTGIMDIAFEFAWKEIFTPDVIF
ncbi:MAG: hypothetical protein LBK96_01900 [Prevotellaceae bacterium]|jgi:hypothetical protein|nr:hypothetical protein [Prevotellaceae bacterium]